MTIAESLYKAALSTVFHDEQDLRSYGGHLYHYTTASGLLGILTSQRIWGTEASYLNDSNEVDYGLSVTRQAIEREFSSSVNDLEKTIAWRALEYLSTKSDEVYVACFSEDGDLLSQWKGYSDLGSGFSVEFDPSRLLRFRRKFPNINISIQKVLYGKDRQQSYVVSEAKKYLSECARLIAAEPEHKATLLSAASHTLSLVLQHQSLFFKAEAFSEEKEWRAVYVNSDLSEEKRAKVQFRGAGNTIVPYIPLDIGDSAQKTEWALPISGIVIGSKVDRVKAEKSIRLIYRNLNMDVPELRDSGIPLQ